MLRLFFRQYDAELYIPGLSIESVDSIHAYKVVPRLDQLRGDHVTCIPVIMPVNG